MVTFSASSGVGRDPALALSASHHAVHVGFSLATAADAAKAADTHNARMVDPTRKRILKLPCLVVQRSPATVIAPARPRRNRRQDMPDEGGSPPPAKIRRMPRQPAAVHRRERPLRALELPVGDGQGAAGQPA